MMKTKIINLTPTTAINQTKNKFWNFIDNGGDTAELELFGTISSEEDWWSDDCVTYRNFINELKALGQKNTINLNIHSPGGDPIAASAIYTALVTNGATINGTVIGLCASAATIVLMACKTRRIAKNAILMAHNPKITLRGEYESAQLVKLAEVTDKVKQSIMTAYKERLNKSEDEISQLMDAESWYVGREAVDAGFCDEVIDDEFQNSDALLNRDILTVNGVRYNFTNYIQNFVPEDIRKKVQDYSNTPQKSGTFSNTFTKGDINKMGEKNTQPTAGISIENAAQLRSAYPDFCNEIVKEEIEKEHKRLRAIESISNGVPEGILTEAKYTKPVTAEVLAFNLMKVNNGLGMKAVEDLADDLKNSGAGSVGAVPTATDGMEQKKEEKQAKVGGFASALKRDRRRGDK